MQDFSVAESGIKHASFTVSIPWNLKFIIISNCFADWFYWKCWVCVLMASMIDCQLIPLINTHNWHLDWYLIKDRYLVDTPSTFDQPLVDSRPSVDQLICINWKLVDCWLTVKQDFDGVSIECQPLCWWSASPVSRNVSQGLIKGNIQGYQSTLCEQWLYYLWFNAWNVKLLIIIFFIFLIHQLMLISRLISCKKLNEY